ncbi:MAG: AIR synthase family protein [Candidatus Bathyarchaeia archaeon]
MGLPWGKLSRRVLEDVVFRHLGVTDSSVLLGPSFGEDAAILRVDDKLFVLACDPITGAEKWVGWLALNASANDVAVQGVRPRWFLSCILLPGDSNETRVEGISRQIGDAAQRISVSVVGGHTEVTPGLTRPIVIGSSIGLVEGRYVTSGGAKSGDKIVLTKGLGIEGTAIIASDLRATLRRDFDDTLLDEAESFFYQVSVVREALTAFRLGATAMHDPTEGGVAGGLHELADASKVGVYVERSKLIVDPITSRLCGHLKVDPLCLISSGTLLATASPEDSDEIVKELKRAGIRAAIVGDVVPRSRGRRMELEDGSVDDLPRPVTDEIWRVVSGGN